MYPTSKLPKLQNQKNPTLTRSKSTVITRLDGGDRWCLLVLWISPLLVGNLAGQDQTEPSDMVDLVDCRADYRLQLSGCWCWLDNVGADYLCDWPLGNLSIGN